MADDIKPYLLITPGGWHVGCGSSTALGSTPGGDIGDSILFGTVLSAYLPMKIFA